MNKQRKRNISLLIFSVFLMVTNIMMSRVNSDLTDSLEVDRKMFTLENTIDVTNVVARRGSETTELSFTNGKWLLNGISEADPTKVHLLFATMQQANIRRPVGTENGLSLRDSLVKHGHTIEFFEGDQLVLSFKSLGDEDQNRTYFQSEEGEVYLMEIPGYRAYIHGLVAVDASTWRNHNLFHKLNWRNLAGLSISYPGTPQDNFNIIQGSRQFEVEGLAETDTTKLFDYVDFISLVEAENYIDNNNLADSASVIIKVDVRDVGNRPYIMEILDVRTEESLRIGRMDSMVYFALPDERIAPIFANRDYFRK